ncbi:MAG: hypothetical protein M3310_02720 [Actinomycetota bacterium]|nr:hypothetical protein [Actinomycetota bacterium]
MILRRGTRVARWRRWLGALPPWRRAAVIVFAVGGVSALAYRGRRWLLQGVAVAADAVEEVADTIEDAAEDLADAARERAASGSEAES